MRLKPMGMSGSDMVSRFSVEAKDTLLAWSARAGCGGLSLVTRGVRVCQAKEKTFLCHSSLESFFTNSVLSLSPENKTRFHRQSDRQTLGLLQLALNTEKDLSGRSTKLLFDFHHMLLPCPLALPRVIWRPMRSISSHIRHQNVICMCHLSSKPLKINAFIVLNS